MLSGITVTLRPRGEFFWKFKKKPPECKSKLAERPGSPSESERLSCPFFPNQPSMPFTSRP
jgi:hypothetical protein